jgi:AcrR family transcriptional regulator
MGIIERKEREKQQRREDIVSAAEKVFFEKGIDIATMDDVAEMAELSKGTLYLYFKSKTELHFAICVRGLEMMKELFANSVRPDKTAIENLVAIGQAYVQFASEHANYFKTMMHFEGISEEDLINSTFSHSPKDDVMNFLYDILEKGKQEGTIRTDIPTPELMHLLWSQTTGVLQFISIKKAMLKLHGVHLDNLFQNHIEILTNGVKPSKALKTNTGNTHFK